MESIQGIEGSEGIEGAWLGGIEGAWLGGIEGAWLGGIDECAGRGLEKVYTKCRSRYWAPCIFVNCCVGYFGRRAFFLGLRTDT
jgi:hypothetical protein